MVKLPYDTSAAKPDSQKARELRDKASEKGWKLPSWMDYRQAAGFVYEGHGVVKDQLDPDTRPTLKRKKALATMGEKDYRDEVKEYKISPYLTSDTLHPLPDTGKQKDMMKATQSWSREGPLLPKEGEETDKLLRKTVKGKNARKKLEEFFSEIQKRDQREYDHRILPVRIGKKNYKWALYVGTQKMKKGKSGFVRVSRRVKVKGGRDLTEFDRDTVDNVDCPVCDSKKGELCVRKSTGQTLKLNQTHRGRLKKYIMTFRKDSAIRKRFEKLKMKGLRGDTGI